MVLAFTASIAASACTFIPVQSSPARRRDLMSAVMASAATPLTAATKACAEEEQAKAMVVKRPKSGAALFSLEIPTGTGFEIQPSPPEFDPEVDVLFASKDGVTVAAGSLPRKDWVKQAAIANSWPGKGISRVKLTESPTVDDYEFDAQATSNSLAFGGGAQVVSQHRWMRALKGKGPKEGAIIFIQVPLKDLDKKQSQVDEILKSFRLE